MGYSVGFNGQNYNTKNVFGSEITALKLAESLTDIYDVYIFVNIPLEDEIIYNNVHYLQLYKINDYEPFDILIILRYLNYFLYCNHNAKKTYIWITDSIINPMYNGDRLPNNGSFLINNMKNKINGLVFVSEWQAQNSSNVINLNDFNKYVIPNPLDISYYKDNIVKRPNSFIYTSDPSRGLDILLHCLIYIQKIIPTISLTVFRSNEFDDTIKTLIQKINNVTIFDKVSQQIIADKCLESEYFFYPTNVPETFCNCAAEAQLYHCVCIYNNVGGLSTTVGNRGLPIHSNINDIDYVEKTSTLIIELINNTTKKNTFIDQGHQWAKTLNIHYIKQHWLSLFNA